MEPQSTSSHRGVCSRIGETLQTDKHCVYFVSYTYFRTDPEVKSPEQAAPVATATPSPKQDHVSFDSSTKKPLDLFILQAARILNVITRPKSEVRKYQDVYYTVTTPLMEAQWKEGGAELTANFNHIFDHIIEKDKKAMIHQWQGKEGGKLNKNSSQLLYRIQVKKYCNSFFLKQGFPVVFRIRVSHEDVHPSKLIVDNANESLHFEKDHIQELDRTIIGYLVGSSPLQPTSRTWKSRMKIIQPWTASRLKRESKQSN